VARSKPSKLLQEHWGSNVRRARGQRSQTWLAREVGVDQTVISRIERGEYKIGPELMVGIAAAMGEQLERSTTASPSETSSTSPDTPRPTPPPATTAAATASTRARATRSPSGSAA